MTGKPTGPGRSSWWYEDDQVMAVSQSRGARRAREFREELFRRAFATSQLPASDGPVVFLDAGCGDGVNLGLLEDLASDSGDSARVIGMDLWSARLKKASRAHSTLLRASVAQIPIRDAAVDICLLSHVLEHVANPEAVLRELKRVTKPSGYIIVAVPNEGCASAKLRNRVIQRHILASTDHIHFFTLKSLTQVARRAGLGAPTFIGREGIFYPHLGLGLRLREHRVGTLIERLATRLLPGQSAGLVVAFPQDHSFSQRETVP